MLRLRVNAEGEAGEAPTVPATDPETEQDLIDISDIKFVLGKLSDTRDMTFSEVKLVIGIEDPRAKERREELGVEDESGVSREDMQYCLQEVKDGEMPEDRVALRRLAEEMREWPYLDLTDEMKAQAAQGGSSYASITNTGVQVKIEDENESDSPVPAWMGYGLLYGISVIPIIIGVTAVIILFVNSLR